MEVEINIDGKKEKIEVKAPTGEDQLYYYNKLKELQKDNMGVADVISLINLQDDMILKMTSRFKNIEEIRKLPLIEKSKIRKVIDDHITGKAFEEETKNSKK